MSQRPNRLIHEKSPYLLQHAYQPVDWYPWGEEAFIKAKEENKPIFLSIGYSTCHWCHVMAHESFDDEEVAKLLNDHFVAIKVDREERPDLDAIYMNVCQAMTGEGGWPLTILMTPEQKPFLAGTYFPKNSKWGRKGLLELLQEVHARWQDSFEQLMYTGERVAEYIRESTDVEKVEVGWDVLERGYEQHMEMFDPEYGGFGQPPKFPAPHHLMFLLRYAREIDDDRGIYMVTKTLDAMARGGIYDHLGYGFARYSVDHKWLVPHFEKMLYDNALLAYAYTEAYQVTRIQRYREIVEQIFTFIEREMTSENGGFYSAVDADSEGEEGKYYVWTKYEIIDVLGEQEGQWFCDYFGVTEQGNFEGRNILNRIDPKYPDLTRGGSMRFAGGVTVDYEKFLEMKQKLLKRRSKRVPPHKDDKILTSWNGMMIAALAKAGRVLQEPKYIDIAKKAIVFIQTYLTREDGRLLARYRDGEAAYLGYVEDYAFLLWALMEMYEATFDEQYLLDSVHLAEELIRLFLDKEKGGLYFTGEDSEKLIARPKEIYDGATPSGNSVAALCLFKLSKMFDRQDFYEVADGILTRFSAQIAQIPFSHSMALQALLYKLQKKKEIIFTGKRMQYSLPEIGRIVQQRYLPESILLYHDEDAQHSLYKQISYLQEYKSIDGKPTLYVCENFACQAPTTDYLQALDELE